jgi:hypothetical protein
MINLWVASLHQRNGCPKLKSVSAGELATLGEREKRERSMPSDPLRDEDEKKSRADQEGQQNLLLETKRRVLQNLLVDITRDADQRWHSKANTYTKIDWYLKAPTGYSKFGAV